MMMMFLFCSRSSDKARFCQFQVLYVYVYNRKIPKCPTGLMISA